jgi:hypothetical protein
VLPHWFARPIQPSQLGRVYCRAGNCRTANGKDGELVNQFLESALDYAERGLAVFPCVPRDKQPLTKHGCKDATTDAEQIRDWWTKTPNANIGIACGKTSGVYVVDVDVKGDIDGRKSLKEFPPLPPTVIAETGGGGLHAFYKTENPPVNKNAFRPGVDLRGEGYYVIAPPSIHPSGQQYRWSPGYSPWECTFAEYPSFLRPPERPAPQPIPERAPQVASATSQPAPRAPSEDVLRRASLYLAQCDPAIQGQAGHNKLLWAAVAMVHGFMLTDDQAYDLLVREYNGRCLPPWDLTDAKDYRDFRRKISEARKLTPEKQPGWLVNDDAYAPSVDARATADVQSSLAGATRKYAGTNTSEASTRPTADAPARFQPFPVDALPEPFAGFVRAACKALGCDASFLALPLLAVAAAMIGTTRVLELKRSWNAPAILWVGIVGESGTMKTPSMKLVLRPIKKRQGYALKRHTEAMKQYEGQLASYDKASAAWKRSTRTDDLPPTKPEPPTAERCIVSDVTVESLAPILLENRRGVLTAVDELSGWFGGFDRYSNGKGADAAHWLSMYSAESITVDRKTGQPRTIFVPTAAVSIVGGIQPGTLRRALGVKHREDGMLARLLLACPPRKAKRWCEAEIDKDVERQYAAVMERLAALQPAEDEQGEPCPVVLQLSPDAKAAWTAFYNSNAAELAGLTGDLAAAWSKLEETAARLALVFACTNAVQVSPPAKPWLSDAPSPSLGNEVDADTMRAAIRLTEWFKAETRRVYALLAESDEDRDRRRLIEWIERHNSKVTEGDVQAGCRWLRAAGAAEAALNQLAKAGIGYWQDAPSGPQGGRPRRVFCLSAECHVS